MKSTRHLLCSHKFKIPNSSSIQLNIRLIDIMESDSDIIVNPSNIGLLGSTNKNYWMFTGRKNVDTAVHSKAGSLLQKECNKLSNLAQNPGDGVLTSSYKLEKNGTKKIAFVVTPRMTTIVQNALDNSQEGLLFQKQLKACFKFPLQAADDYGYKSISMPALSCGVGQCDPHISAKLMLETMLEYFKEKENSSIRSITCCMIEKKTYSIFTKMANNIL